MQFTISKGYFVAALDAAARIADPKSTMPILSHALISAYSKAVEVAATDLYLSARTESKAQVTKSGSVCLPARNLLARVKAMPEGNLKISVDDKHRATIVAVGAKRKFVLPGLPGEEFPKLPQREGEKQTIAADGLSELLSLTAFSVSLDES